MKAAYNKRPIVWHFLSLEICTMKYLVLFTTLFFTSKITFAQAPVNDAPCGAIALTVQDSSTGCTNKTLISMVGATINNSIDGLVGGVNMHKDLWYKFTMPASGKVHLEGFYLSSPVTTSNDMTLQVYKANNCSDSLEFINDDDDNGQGLMPLLNITNGIAGDLYFVRVFHFDSSLADSSFNFCLHNLASNGSNVGIGTITPTEKLEVIGNIKTNGLILPNNANAGKVLTSDATGNATWQNLPAGSNTWNISGNDIVNTNSGNIGIGNSSPNAPLSLANTTANKKISLFDIGNDHQFYGLGVNTSTFRYQVPALIDDHVFYAGVNSTSSNELFRIKGNGNASHAGGIILDGANVNNSDLATGLQFGPLGSGEGILSKRTTGGNQFGLDLLTAGDSRLNIENNGRVTVAGKDFWDLTSTEGDFRIGTNNYRIKMGVSLNGGGAGAGRIRAVGGINTLYLGAGNTDVLTLLSNGNATLAGTLTQLSDARLKTNIQPLQNSLQRIQKLNGYTYNWIDKTKDQNKQIGFLAQEIQKEFPELTTEIKQENGEINIGVNYTNMIPVLLEAIKEQQKQIEELKKKVAELEITNK
jgi:hypothetical protein